MKKSVFKKFSLLVFCAAFIKVLGFVFRIYLSRVAGAEGCGLYQLVLSVYSFGASISSFGISQTMSRLVAYNEKYSKRILKTALIITGAVSFVVSAVTFLFSEYIALDILKDSRLVMSIRAISFCFPAISVFASISGYFNGLTRVKYAATGQMAEQLARILFVFIFAEGAIKNGIENGVLVMSLGVVLGEFISSLYVFLSYRGFAKTKKEGYTKKRFVWEILKLSVPLASGGYITSFMHTIENIMLPCKLSVFGLSSGECLSILGIAKGMAVPILFFPVMIITSMSTLVLPKISKADSLGDTKRIRVLALKILAASLFVGILSTFFLFFHSEKITILIYGNTAASRSIKIMSCALPFLYYNIGAGGILNGLGRQGFTLVENILKGAVKLFSVMVLVPSWGINGYFFGFITSEITGFILTFIFIFNVISAKRCKKL